MYPVISVTWTVWITYYLWYTIICEEVTEFLAAFAYSCKKHLRASSWLSLSSCISLALNRYLCNLMVQTIIKSIEQIQIWLKMEKNMWHFTWRCKYIYTVDSSATYFVDRKQHKWNSFLISMPTVNSCTLTVVYSSAIQTNALLFSWQLSIFILLVLGSSTISRPQYVSIATMVAWTHHVTSRTLSCYWQFVLWVSNYSI